MPQRQWVWPSLHNTECGWFCTAAAAGSRAVETYSCCSPEDLRRRANDQQLQEIRDVVEEAELAHTMIHSLAHGSGSSLVSGARSVTGSSCTTFNPLQRTKSSGLHDR